MNNERFYPTFAEERELLELKKRFGITNTKISDVEKSPIPENNKGKQTIIIATPRTSVLFVLG